MTMIEAVTVDPEWSVVRGLPLHLEAGIGALTLADYLREVTHRYAPQEAVVMHHAEGAERWTYEELWQQALAVAKALTACGVGKGTRVGILMTNRPEFLAAVFGTALVGGIAATLSTFSTPNELAQLLKSADCAVLLFEQQVLKKDFSRMLEALLPECDAHTTGQVCSTRFPFLRHLVVLDRSCSTGIFESWSSFVSRGESIATEHIDAMSARVTPADPALLFFSSGSTGRPKGILSAHRGVCLQLWRWRKWLSVDENLRTWSANGFFWSGNFALALGATLSAGGALILQPTFDAELALQLMEKERVSYFFAWPHQWAQMAAANSWNKVDLSALRYVDVHSPFVDHPTVTQAQFFDPTHGYGNTETFTLTAMYPANTPPEVSRDSFGLPVPGNTIKIVDPLTGAVMPLGEPGEIVVKGPTLMLGYVDVPLSDSVDEVGFFHTGDGGFFDKEGRLYWQGRLNDIIKTGGANVSPLEIDAVLVNCAGVKIVRSVGIPDELLGERIVACVVRSAGSPVSGDDIRNYAKQHLASYKVPKDVLFCDENDLELTGSAKIKLDQLRELAQRRLRESSVAVT